MKLQIPDLQTELEKSVFWTSYPAGFPSFLGRFLLVKVGWYFNEIDQEWRPVWMYYNPTEDEYLLDSDVNQILSFSFHASGERGSSSSSPAPRTNIIGV